MPTSSSSCPSRQRQGDEYARVAGVLVESPMRALTEFMLALGSGDATLARQRATEARVVEQALVLGWDRLVGEEWMVMYYLPPKAGEQQLALHRIGQDPWFEAQYVATMVWRDGRWLVGGAALAPPLAATPSVSPTH